MNGFTLKAWDEADQSTRNELLYGAVINFDDRLKNVEKKVGMGRLLLIGAACFLSGLGLINFKGFSFVLTKFLGI